MQGNSIRGEKTVTFSNNETGGWKPSEDDGDGDSSNGCNQEKREDESVSV